MVVCENSAAPFVITGTNSPLLAGGSPSVFGTYFQVGSSKQAFSAGLSLSDTNILLTAASTCANGTGNLTCLATYGGLWNPSLSTTISVQTAVQTNWNGSQDDSAGIETAVYFNDDIYLGSSKLPQTPFISVSSPSYGGYVELEGDVILQTYPATIGLQGNSSFVREGIKAGLFPSRHFSLSTSNTEGLATQQNQLIVGGYDNTYWTGPPVNFSNPYGGAFTVNITNIECHYYHPDNLTSLWPSDLGSLSATLDPTYARLELPYEIVNKFRQVLGAQWVPGPLADDDPTYFAGAGLNWTTFAEYTLAKPPGSNGGLGFPNFYITLSNGYKTNISSNFLYGAFKGLDSSGNVKTLSNNFRPLVSSLTVNSTVGATLGLPFLNMNYLMSDPDNNVFAMAPINNTVPYYVFNKSAIQPFCSAPIITSSKNSTNNTNSTFSGSNSFGGNSSTHTGAIVGGVVGGLAGVLILFLAWFFIQRHRRRQNNPIPGELDAGQTKTSAEVVGSPMSEMGDAKKFDAFEIGVAQKRAEMADNKEQWRKELPGSPVYYEMEDTLQVPALPPIQTLDSVLSESKVETLSGTTKTRNRSPDCPASIVSSRKDAMTEQSR